MSGMALARRAEASIGEPVPGEIRLRLSGLEGKQKQVLEALEAHRPQEPLVLRSPSQPMSPPPAPVRSKRGISALEIVAGLVALGAVVAVIAGGRSHSMDLYRRDTPGLEAEMAELRKKAELDPASALCPDFGSQCGDGLDCPSRLRQVLESASGLAWPKDKEEARQLRARPSYAQVVRMDTKLCIGRFGAAPETEYVSEALSGLEWEAASR
jgi:hypothetical protein